MGSGLGGELGKAETTGEWDMALVLTEIAMIPVM